MWIRRELKENAKLALKKHYWIAFAACLAYTILAGLVGSGSSFTSGGRTSSYQSGMTSLEATLVGFMFVMVILGIIYGIFVKLPLEAGKNYFFLNARDNTAEISHLFSSFRKGRYLNTVKTLFFRDLFIMLWTLLLIIPGIIKSYEYFMMPYLMAENPELTTKRAFEISKEMTAHNKFNIFVLQVSFIWWYLLALIPCGLGFFFLMPYTEGTFTEMYLFKRAEMLQTGFVTSDELPGFSQQAESVF